MFNFDMMISCDTFKGIEFSPFTVCCCDYYPYYNYCYAL